MSQSNAKFTRLRTGDFAKHETVDRNSVYNFLFFEAVRCVMTTFALKGYKGKCLHGSISCAPIVCSGMFHASGPQPVTAVPVRVVQMFDENPDLHQISVSTKEGGVVYQRMD